GDHVYGVAAVHSGAGATPRSRRSRLALTESETDPRYVGWVETPAGRAARRRAVPYSEIVDRGAVARDDSREYLSDGPHRQIGRVRPSPARRHGRSESTHSNETDYRRTHSEPGKQARGPCGADVRNH